MQGEQILLRVYLHGADRTPHEPTYLRLVQAARRAKLAGATVLRGIMGFGSGGHVHHAGGWKLVEHVPVILEIVDSAEKIRAFLQGPMNELMVQGTATVERAHVILYRHEKPRAALENGGTNEPARIGPRLIPLSTIPRIEGQAMMTMQEDGVLLRVFIGEADRSPEGKPLHEAILLEARRLGLAGATVLRGALGFGAKSVVHRANLLEMSTDLPIVVEIVDSESKIQQILPVIEGWMREGMITMEHVGIIAYRADQKSPN